MPVSDQPPPEHPRRDSTAPGTSDSPSVVSVHNAGVALGGRPVLRRIDLEVRAGDFVALMGANGSGKSTLVRAIVGLRPLVNGEIRLFGTPLEHFSQWRRIGFVPQRASAVSGVPASVWEVVAAGRLTRRRLLRPLNRADRAAIDDALEVVGLADRRRDAVSNLSGGQQQRVLIARALAGEPELFFLDEPTAGVDLPNQQVLAETLGRLKERGSTIVLVAHELGPLAPLVDRAVVLRDGRVAYDGPALSDHEVHEPRFAEPHTHHHHPHESRGVVRDHVPHVASPVDRHPEEHE
ncbi:metal ABC transporter ATP-binding protein [Nocardioides sp. zg-536]|uniref:Metal ABC transporter ATP-binding protein n=1 Tax=Nocardioides faecalis TaxID=2803858 RepID=A0A938Y8T9_9ACTN|nr:metal ABC transporter ATP-binding protein [Nocardioides faecalis]QVI59877.1 metal ABC transporter ATP-binding protein [Nocardioides faecalis]